MVGSTFKQKSLWRFLGALSLWLWLGSAPVYAQPRTDACRLIAQSAPIWRAAIPLAPNEVRLTFVGHSTFLIESPKGVAIETDYNDYLRSGQVPDIVTMNKAHSTHYSLAPASGIGHILRGWGEAPGEPAQHDVSVKDVFVRNVPTNIRNSLNTEINGNSIFIFEVAGLCIGHLGHLHHPLEPEQLQAIGRIDVLMVPVDGSWTLDLSGMIEVVKSLSPAILLPMHYFNPWTLNRFIERVKDEWQVEHKSEPVLTVSRASLPATPKLIVLPGQ